MPFYDFKCKENHVTEENISYTDMQKGIKCSKCGQHAERIYSINSLWSFIQVSKNFKFQLKFKQKFDIFAKK